MATTSQKMMEIRFLVRIRGALTPPPRIEEPVMKMPLEDLVRWGCVGERLGRTMLLLLLRDRCRDRCLDLPTVVV